MRAVGTSADAGQSNRVADVKSMARAAARVWHRMIASQPFVAGQYLRAVGSLVRQLPDDLNKRRLVNALKEATWPDVALPDRAVRVGTRHAVRLVPHAGEFDFDALFFRQLVYESEVFVVLESRLPRYDAIIEIGANVGVYTVYFATACHEGQAIFAFEPSPKAFGRMKQNLALNGAGRVQAFNMAVSNHAGRVPFFEPAGHLTNGSLKRDFAAFFSDDVATSTVEAVDGRFLAELLVSYKRPLIKIDVEGAEADVLHGLADVIGTWRPDLVIEVLGDYEATLNALDFITSRYQLFNITGAGLVEKQHFEADGQHRDYLLISREARHS
jgi:FkbM family methyltransferase